MHPACRRSPPRPRPGISRAPGAVEQRARLLDRDLPEREDFRVGALVAPAGNATPGTRVQGKFSIHEPCEESGSIACTFAQVLGAFHQLWKRTLQPLWSAAHSVASCCTAPLPPWPLQIMMRLKPLCAMPSRMSRTSARCVSTRSVIEPGNSRKYGVTP